MLYGSPQNDILRGRCSAHGPCRATRSLEFAEPCWIDQRTRPDPGLGRAFLKLPHPGVDGMDANMTATVVLPKAYAGLRNLIHLAQAARPRQWIKNLACFAGLVFSGRLFEATPIGHSLL